MDYLAELLQTLDRQEMRFAFNQPAPFEGMEGEVKLSVDTEEDMERMRRVYEELWGGGQVLDLREAIGWVEGLVKNAFKANYTTIIRKV